ncbi:MAG TPA: adenylyl-sulfate kinase [Bacteroidales bacterium]|jgi:adenylylsulfate kinase|nr:adenylyl-sulfate kinase [Bacteroidota bacterium]HJN06528.1 adenylyl-sulfate kinase [Bacteroidales bacterium]|tara:strand:- start:268 stop:822 length:555 start_codon:yes stop_codon:yes gene_type:complete
MSIKQSSNSRVAKDKIGTTIWFTGLSGSGKTTMANHLQKALLNKGISSVILDGDEVRKTINNDLGFSISDREENNRRIAEIAKIINKSGGITICAFITPTNKIRENIKHIIGDSNFILVFVDTPLETCEKRDKKSLYKKAKEGKVKNFSGITSIFEEPTNPDIILDGLKSVDENIEKLLIELKH